MDDRIQSKISPEPNSGCWLWTASLDGKGYGQISMNGRPRRAHRVVYEAERGPIPAGLDLDHKCRNPVCVNPDHLEPVTRAVNLARGIGNRAALKAKTHCKNGHEYSGANVVIQARPDRKYSTRRCVACAMAAQHRFRGRVSR